MSAGYGRGHYGDEQLAPRRSGGGWLTAAIVVGVGAVIWLKWPKKPPALVVPASAAATPPLLALPAASTRTREDDAALDQIAQLHGFASGRAYEDAIVANARELKKAGAMITLAPHLQHLEARLQEA